MADDSRKLATASSLGKPGIIFLLMTIFFCMFLLAVSGIVSWKVSLVFLLNMAE